MYRAPRSAVLVTGVAVVGLDVSLEDPVELRAGAGGLVVHAVQVGFRAADVILVLLVDQRAHLGIVFGCGWFAGEGLLGWQAADLRLRERRRRGQHEDGHGKAPPHSEKLISVVQSQPIPVANCCQPCVNSEGVPGSSVSFARKSIRSGGVRPV